MLNYNVKFLTCDDKIHIKNGDFKSYTYETKKKVEESVYDNGKRSFCERRGGHWRPPRPRQIRQLDAKLRDRSLIVCEWTTDSLITLVFSSGAIAYLTVKPDTLDVIQILFDRYCVSKLSGQAVTGAIVCQSHLMFCHDRLATLITYGKNANTMPCRISDRDPHIQNIELGGARRSDRKISSCDTKTGLKILVWSTSTVEPAPWSPVVEDHANLHLYRINGQHMTLVAYHQLENETLSAELSHKCDCTVHIVEQITCHKNGVNLNWIRYKVPNSDERATKLSPLRESETQVSLPAPARSVRRSPCDLKLLTACIDGSLHVVHNSVGVTHSVRAGFIATEVRWAGELIVAAEEGGRMQCFDRALSLLHHHTKCFDLASYLRDAKRMQILTARKARGGPIIVLSFSGGPLALLHIAHPRLLTAWLRANRPAQAVALLRALNWDDDGMECLWAVNKLVCYAFRSGTDALSAEGTAQAALGAYFSAAAPPPPAAAARYAPPLVDLARKLFHHMLRRGRIEKALSLAVDVRAWDLFVDARWAAARAHNHALMHEAEALAQHYATQQAPDSDCSDSCSQCSSHSCSGDTSASEVKTKPPPLPRLNLSTPTTPSTNSIRPNLHQYLERDNTIWTTNVDDTYVKISGHDRIKPILTQNGKWGLEMSLHQRLGTSIPTLAVIDESPTKSVSSIVDVIPRIPDDKVTSAHFRSLYHTELREEHTSNLYRYHSNNYRPSSLMDRGFKFDNGADRGSRPTEKNKVKFSDTVTMAVVSEPSSPCPESARELADSLPLCAPHKYLAAFAPQPRPPPPQLPPAPPPPAPPPPAPQPPPPHAGTTLDYVEV